MELLNDTELNSWDIDCSIDIARLSMEDGSPHAAIASVNAVLEANADHAEALELRALAAKELGSEDRFVADVERLMQIHPHRVRPYLLMSGHLLQRGKVHDALKVLHEASFRVFFDDPDYPELMRVHRELKATEYNQLIQLPPEVIRMILADTPLKTRAACIAVSTKWRRVLIRVPGVWQDVDFGSPAHHKHDSVIQALNHFASWASIRQLRMPLSDRALGVLMRAAQSSIRVLDLTHSFSRVDDLLLVLAMRQLGRTWQAVSFSASVSSPRLFFTAAALFCPQLKTVKVTRFYNPPRYTFDEQGEQALLADLGYMSVDPNMPVAVEHLTIEHSFLDELTLESIFLRCSALRHLGLVQCKGMVNTPHFFCNIIECLPAAVVLDKLLIQQTGDDHYGEHILGTDPASLCGLLRNRPPNILDLNRCSLYREATIAIANAMQSGTLLRYDNSFAMDRPQNRQLLQLCMRADKTRQMILDQLEMQAIQEWMSSQGWSQEDFGDYDGYYYDSADSPYRYYDDDGYYLISDQEDNDQTGDIL